jgi:hypothetical protein
MCRKLSKSESTIVENGDRQSGARAEVYWPFAISEYYAARSMRGDRRPIETGVTLDLSSLLMSRIRWLLASLMRA